MKPEQLKELRELAELSTKVVSWYPHGPEATDEATVRGPFCRWLKVSNVSSEYRKHVADPKDEAKFVAAAMNNLVPLLDHVDRLTKRLEHLQSIYSLGGHEVIEQNLRLREALQVAMRSVESDAALSFCRQALEFHKR